MQYIQTFFIGIFVAAVIGGVWWLILFSGLIAILIKRSYVVLTMGAVLDLWFITVGEQPFFYIGFYTVIFVVTTLCIEYIRARLLWTS